VGGSVSLTVQGVSANGGTLAGVSFYLDSNGNGQWSAGVTLLGTVSIVSGSAATLSIGAGGLAAGSYELFARALDTNGQWSSAVNTRLMVAAPAAVGTNPATAMVVAIGSTVEGNMANSGGTIYFEVQVVAGEKYTFQTALGSLYDSVLTLLGPNGQTVIAQNDDMAPGNRASRIAWQATATGTYYLAVSGYPGSPAGSFSLVTSGPSAPASAPSPAPTPAPTPAPAAPSLAPIGKQTLVAGGSLTVALVASGWSNSRLSYSASAAGSSAVSVVVYGDQLTIRAAANYVGSVQVAVTASNGTSSAVQSFNVTVISAQPATGQAGGSVAIPSASLSSSASAVVLASNPHGVTTSSTSNVSQKLDPAAVDTLYHALGR
jgi:hypothetical protein